MACRAETDLDDVLAPRFQAESAVESRDSVQTAQRNTRFLAQIHHGVLPEVVKRVLHILQRANHHARRVVVFGYNGVDRLDDFGRRLVANAEFNGFGGTLAPDLSYEGSRAQRPWLISFLKNPQTLRPTLVLRMPQFNMTDREAEVLADYIGLVLQNPAADPSMTNAKAFTPQQVALGKQLYEVKYQCQSCHTIGSAGGYVGPNLNNAGNWLTPAWIADWLRNPQALVPGTIEPRRQFSEDEIQALTAYLTTLRQSGKPQSTTQAASGTGSGEALAHVEAR